jgi:hypothetical protein
MTTCLGLEARMVGLLAALAQAALLLVFVVVVASEVWR